jgi:2-polyprenyl-6-methoxyphenol hydroxylase-like FAD-dependent oxidoreductase
MKPLDIAVAGCGPAGLATALMLARDGHRVTLFERFGTPRPIGSGLMMQPTGLAVLRTLGLRDSALAKGARIDRLTGQTASGRVVLDVRYSALRRPTAFGLGVHRAALFGVLFDAVRAAGLTVETNRTVASAEAPAGDRRSLVFTDGSRVGPFDLVVDALGAATPLAPPTGRILPYGAFWASLDWVDGAGFDAAALEQRYAGAHTMAGVMPIGRIEGFALPQAAFFWSLRQDRLEAWRREGLAAWKSKVLALWPGTRPLLDQISTPDRLTFARYRHRTLRIPAERGLIHIGDAWRSTSPQLGQGANMALLDAWALAAALRSSPDVPSALARAVQMRRAHVAIYQSMSYLFTPVYQSDSRLLPLLRDRLVGPLARIWPATWLLAAIVGGLVGEPLRRLGLSLDGIDDEAAR